MQQDIGVQTRALLLLFHLGNLFCPQPCRYDLETGEPSVFAKELNKGRAAGHPPCMYCLFFTYASNDSFPYSGSGSLLALPGVSLTAPTRSVAGKGPDYLYHGAKRLPGQPWSQVKHIR